MSYHIKMLRKDAPRYILALVMEKTEEIYGKIVEIIQKGMSLGVVEPCGRQ